MPASSIESYLHLQDARKIFGAARPAPIATDVDNIMGQYPNIHISTNCYYGYHNTKNSTNMHDNIDCEMLEIPASKGTASPEITTRKRCADSGDYPQSKRLRDEVLREKTIEPETNETMRSETNSEDLLESLYWNIHGGNIFHLIVCDC